MISRVRHRHVSPVIFWNTKRIITRMRMRKRILTMRALRRLQKEQKRSLSL